MPCTEASGYRYRDCRDHGPRMPTAAELAEARRAGVPWKVLERRFGYSRSRLWEILTGRSVARTARKDVVTTSSPLPAGPIPVLASAPCCGDTPNG
jgi:hypothetical protein